MPPTLKFLHSIETRSITLECCRRELDTYNKSYDIRLASKSAKLVNARTVRCFSAFAPTRILLIDYDYSVAVRLDGKKIDPSTPWSKSI